MTLSVVGAHRRARPALRPVPWTRLNHSRPFLLPQEHVLRLRAVFPMAAATLLAVTVLGCALPRVDDPNSAGPSGAVTPSAKAPKPTTTADSLEGKFTRATMNDYLDVVADYVHRWASA